MKKIIAIIGPTAVGKTYVSLELAKKLNTEIISADSMQIYKGMDIGTAKITDDEKSGILHHMIDIVNPDREYSVSEFKHEAEKIIDRLAAENKVPIIVGGSGLYVNSLIYDLDFGKVKSNKKIREYYTTFYKDQGADALYEQLMKRDPEACKKIHKNNVKRVIRALEVCDITGKKFSDLNTDIRKPSPEYDSILIGLSMERKVLYERINPLVGCVLVNYKHLCLFIIFADYVGIHDYPYDRKLRKPAFVSFPLYECFLLIFWFFISFQPFLQGNIFFFFYNFFKNIFSFGSDLANL
jgi:tRNA dimethylallyltransferase